VRAYDHDDAGRQSPIPTAAFATLFSQHRSFEGETLQRLALFS